MSSMREANAASILRIISFPTTASRSLYSARARSDSKPFGFMPRATAISGPLNPSSSSATARAIRIRVRSRIYLYTPQSKPSFRIDELQGAHAFIFPYREKLFAPIARAKCGLDFLPPWGRKHSNVERHNVSEFRIHYHGMNL